MTFLLIQTVIGIYVGASLILLLSGLDAPALAWLQRYLAQYDPLDLRRAAMRRSLRDFCGSTWGFRPF